MTSTDDLITLVDFCNEMATIIRGDWADIRGDWTDPRTECRAIWDAHDLAHFLTGGDAQRDWTYIRSASMFDSGDGPGIREVMGRVRELIERATAKREAQP